MNKKIASEFAIGIIIFVAVLVGGVIFLQSRQNDSFGVSRIPMPETSGNPSAVASAQSSGTQNTDVCKAHYYEGSQQVHVWPVAQAASAGDSSVVLNIQANDAKTLPIKDESAPTDGSSFTVKLVDASSAVKNKIVGATQEKPAVITIQGYAEVCTQPPLISLQPATVAFKKS